MNLDELYHDLILDHFRHPRGEGTLIAPQASVSVNNPLCGDRIELQMKTEGGNIKELAFSGHGCSISKASASMMVELCKGKTREEVERFIKLFQGMMAGVDLTKEKEELGDLLALEGVKKFAARLRCVLLAWEALETCLTKVK